MAVGDVFKKRRNLVQSAASKPRAGYGARVNAFKVEPTGNPMRDWAEAERAATGSINRMQPGQAGQAWGQAQRDWAEQERGATLGWGEQPATRQADVFQLTGNAGGPWSFNPQNQDVLARASAALDAVKQDRLNPMYGGAQGYAAPGQNVAIQGSPGLRGFVNSVGSGLASAYNSVASALTAPPQMYNGPMENVRPERLSDLQDTPDFRFSWNGAGSGDVPNLADALNDPQPSNPIRNGYAPAGRGPVPRSVASQAPNYYQQQAAGMDAESVRRRDLAGQIDALRQRSQRDNPMAPQAPAYDPMQAEIDRGTRQGNIMFEPGATSSSGATRNFRNIEPDELNSTTAGTVNGYNGQTGYAQNPMRLSPEQKYDFAKRNARRIVGGGAAADPTNMRGRFGGAYGAGLDADAAAIAGGTAVRLADGTVVRHTGTQDQARAAQVAGKTEREALRDRNNMNVPQAELDRRAAADAQKAARAAKHQAFKDANGGMSYRQYDRMTGSSNGNNALTMKAVREGRLSPEEANYRMQLRAEKALRRSGNPITGGTSQAGRFFPDQMAGRGGQNQAGPNPISSAASDRFRPGGIVTPESSQAAKDTLKVLAEGGNAPDGTAIPPSPLFSSGLKDSPDNIQGVHFGIQQIVQEGKDLAPSDLQSLHAAAVAMQAGYGTPDYDPFDMTYGFEGTEMVDKAHTEAFGPMYKELAGMKSPTPDQLSKWWASFKSRIAPQSPGFGEAAIPGVTESFGGYEYPLPANPMKP